jgi:hypothetical protein
LSLILSAAPKGGLAAHLMPDMKEKAANALEEALQ